MSTPSLDANTATIRRKPPARRPVRVPREGPLNPDQSVEALRRDLLAGRPWYPALLKVVGRWSVAEEMVGDRLCRYLIEGEAFDWLLLAQRLISEVEDLIPADDVERLLLFGVAPPGHSEESFAQAIGGPKHRAHLNYQYGVTVEELLLLSAELELQKAGRLSGAGQRQPDILAFERVYGKRFEELRLLFATESGTVITEQIHYGELQRFIYWLSKFRLRHSEPARVASDTRKALSLMSRLEAGRTRLAGAAQRPAGDG